MVRRKIEIKPIEDKSKRHTTFTKRRKGLMKKTEEFCLKSDSSAAIITFSNAGNCYVLAHPDVDSVLGRYEAASSASSASFEAGSSGAAGESSDGCEEEEEAAAAATEVEKRIYKGVKSGRWEEAVEGLETQELDELFADLQDLWFKLDARETKLRAASAAEEEIAVEGESGSSGEGSCRSC